MKKILYYIDRINNLGERQIISPSKRKLILSLASFVAMLFIGITSVSLLTVSASNSEEVSKEVGQITEVKKTTTKLISDEVTFEEVQLISAEAVIEEIVVEEVVVEEVLGEVVNLGEGSETKFISIGQGTLITGIANSNSTVVLTTEAGTVCTAKTNASGKFGCMFATEKILETNVVGVYQN